MNANYLIRIVMRQVVNRLVRAGIDAGMRKVGTGSRRRRNDGVSRPGDRAETWTDADRPGGRGQKPSRRG